MRATVRLIVALMLALLAPQFASADLAAKPNAYTENDRYKECLEFNRKTLVDSYKAIGNKNPAWDAEAVKFLELSSVHFASAGSGALKREKPPTWEQLITAGELAVKKGCDDPIVLYCYGAFLTESDRVDEGKPVLLQAYKGLIQSKYPVERIYYAGRRLLGHTQNIKERMEISGEMDKARSRMLTVKFVNCGIL